MKYILITIFLSFNNLYGQIDSIAVYTDFGGHRTNLHFSRTGELKILQDDNIESLDYKKYISGIAFKNKIDAKLTSALFKKINNLDRCEACEPFEGYNDSNCICDLHSRTHSFASTIKLFNGDSLEHTFSFYLDEEEIKPMQISIFKELFELLKYPGKQKWDPSNFDIKKIKNEEVVSIELIKYSITKKGGLKSQTKVNLAINEFEFVTKFLNEGKKEHSFKNGKLLNIDEYKNYYVLILKHKNSDVIKYKMSQTIEEVYFIDEKHIRLKIYSKIKLNDRFSSFVKEKFK